ncbi:TonB-dependent receptor domain-containing protein [Vreelandella hamiltonii]|uniref:Ligand-gated channel protein n=1 Tax=Halomonas johnsoniae TaxID=502832 RepID=A0ABQ2WKV6_9GAMM|nr:TonB-dependent receptor [Halomonas johnsoniae]GGW61654.1 ligand-gated channel protein [Halomonas johnsoniae]
MKPSYSLGICLTLLPLLSVQADDSSLHPVTVTGTRAPTDLSSAPLIIDIIDRTDTELATASRVEDILSRQPGLHVAGQGRRNGQTLSMRGFGRNGVLVRLDGVRQDITTGHIGNFFLDPALVQEVQVARGALSSLYGSNAMGGVVSFTTVEASDLLAAGENSGARLSVGGATASGELRGNLSAFGRQDTSRGQVDGLFSVGRSESGDIRRAGGDKAEEDASLNSLLVKGGWEPNDEHRLFIGWQYYDEDTTQPANPQQRDVTTSNPLRDREVESHNLQLGHRWQPSPVTDITSRLSFSQQEISEPQASRTLERIGLQSDGYHRLEHGWLSQTLVFGAELEQARQRPEGGANGFPHADIDTQAAYLDTTLTAGRYLAEGGAGQWDLGVGARYDRYDASGQASDASVHDRVSPRFRVAWRPQQGVMLFSGYAEAFRAPSLSELYASERHFAGFCAGPFFCAPDNFWIPNPELAPETSHTWESGVVWHQGDWQARASYFDTRADDFIDTQVDIMAGTTQAVNVQRAQLWGYDARLAWQPSAFPLLTSFAGLSEVSGKDRDSGEALGSQTPLEMTLGSELALYNRALRVGWQGRFARDFDKQSSDERLPGYGLNDLHLAWQVTPALDTSLRLANVGDKEWYRPDGSLGDGRSLFATLNWQW